MNNSAEKLKLAIRIMIIPLAIVGLFLTLEAIAISLWTAVGFLIGFGVAIFLWFLLADAVCQALIDIAETKQHTMSLMNIAQQELTLHRQTTTTNAIHTNTVTKTVHIPDTEPANLNDDKFMQQLNELLEQNKIDLDAYTLTKNRILNYSNLTASKMITGMINAGKP